MAIKGSLREASLADVLQLLALSRKTGCLSVSDRGSLGRIFFDQGTITHASIVNRKDRLADLLVKNAVVSEEQLERYIRAQIEEAVYFLFTWNQGTFYFEPDQVPDPAEPLVAIHPEGLLLEGARRVDEWTLIEKEISSPDLIFGLDWSHSDPRGAELTPDQWRILQFLDGRRTVAEIVEASGMLEFEASKAIFELVQAGVARDCGRKAAAVDAGVRSGRLQEHRNLGIAFYRARMYDESEREFLRILELERADFEDRFHLSLIAVRRGDYRRAVRSFMQLIDEGGRSASAFHNLALALEATGRLDEALLTVEQALASFPADRPLLMSRAVLLTRQGRLSDACEAFDAYSGAAAAEATPPAAFFAYSAIALAAVGRIAEARGRADEGMALYPRCAPLLTNAAAILERSGAVDEAEALYRRAVDERPATVQAQRGLADALYRRGAYEEAGAIYATLLRSNGDGSNGSPPRGADVGELTFKLGNIAYKRGERLEAIRYWRATVEADPGHTVARTNLELVQARGRG